MAVKQLFPQLSDDASYLVGREIEPDNFECSACCCPICILYVESPKQLRARCASCGAAGGRISTDEHAYLARLAAETKWDSAIKEDEKTFGHWWSEVWLCMPRGH
jgi:hypothetical protein